MPKTTQQMSKYYQNKKSKIDIYQEFDLQKEAFEYANEYLSSLNEKCDFNQHIYKKTNNDENITICFQPTLLKNNIFCFNKLKHLHADEMVLFKAKLRDNINYKKNCLQVNPNYKDKVLKIIENNNKSISNDEMIPYCVQSEEKYEKILETPSKKNRSRFISDESTKCQITEGLNSNNYDFEELKFESEKLLSKKTNRIEENEFELKAKKLDF